MDLLEMPLDVLAFRFYSLPTIAVGWTLTWLLVIAASIGLWCIRAVGSRSDVSALPSPPPPPPPPKLVGATQAHLTPPAKEEADPAVLAPALDPSTPKARFTAYYDVDCGGSCHVDEVGEEVELDDDGGFTESVDGPDVEITARWMGRDFRWEETVVRWRGDLGWYDYQEITALNGRVVRLWHRESGLTAAQKGRGRKGIYAF